MYKIRVFEMLEKLGPEQATAAPVLPGPVFTVAAPGADRIERNDPCPCGSGKKWKNCGLKNTEEHQKLTADKQAAQ